MESSPESLSSVFSPTPSSPPKFDIWGNIKTISFPMWIMIVLLLSLLGFNVFTFLAEGTRKTSNIFSNIFGPLLKLFGFGTLESTKQTIDMSKEGVDAIADTATSAIDAVEERVVGHSAGGTNAGAPSTSTFGGPERPQADPIAQALQAPGPQQSEPEPATGGNSGWCYIGEESNERTCASVGVNDTCMSGNIYPSQDICVNPELRQ